MNTSTSQLAQRPIGNSKTEISALGFGCMGLVGWYGTRNDAEARACLLEAVTSGITHYDTAASYQVGENERFVGSVLAPFRKHLFIATKCGLSRGPDGSVQADNRPETIRSSCEASLTRLGMDYIDLFYLHRIDRNVPIEDSVGALLELIRAGKIRHAGLSECSIATLQRACKVLPIGAVQSEYSIWSRDPEQGMLQACNQLNVSFVAYSPLGRGFLAANFRSVNDLPETDHRRSHPRFQPEAADTNAALVATLQQIGASLNATPAQVAIAWVLARSPRVVTIPGMKTRAHLMDNLRGSHLQLAPDQILRIEALAQRVQGERHPPAMMRMLDR